jgi:4-amino-4-deoxy-L-arabinose transferase
MMNRTKISEFMTVRRRYAALLMIFFLLGYLLPLGSRDLLVPDETRYAEIPREMIAGGDWVTPHLNGLRYFEKPVFGYWVHAASQLLFGESNFAVRLPSVVAVALSALLIMSLVAQVSRKEGGGTDLSPILAALIFISSMEVAAVGNIAVLDSLFSFFLTATLTAFFFATESGAGSRGEKGFLLLSGIACGLAFLTKGFLAFAVPVLVLVPYLLWQRRYTDLLRMSWLPLLTAILVTLPWSIAIYLREPDFWRFFFWNEHIRRFLSDTAQHKASFWFFFVAAPGLFMPWTFLIPAAGTGIWKGFREQGQQDHLIRFAICWLVLPFLFFSVSRGKLVTYILPCFPAFAILMGMGLSQALAEGKRKAFQWGVATTGILMGLILLGFVYIQVAGYQGFHFYSRPLQAAIAGAGIAFMVCFCFAALYTQNKTGKVLRMGLAPLLLFFVAHFCIPDVVLQKNDPGRLLQENQARIGADALVISCEEAVSAVCWNLKRDVVYLLKSAGELTYGLTYRDAVGRLLDLGAAASLVDRNGGKTVIISKAKGIKELHNVLPMPAYQDDSGPAGFVLWHF